MVIEERNSSLRLNFSLTLSGVYDIFPDSYTLFNDLFVAGMIVAKIDVITTKFDSLSFFVCKEITCS
jgi:hypothetical protein